MLDLTIGRFLECIKGHRSYTYDNQNFPLNIFFEDKVKTRGIDWTEASIGYQPECSDDDVRTQDKTIRQECTLSDVQSMYNNETLAEDNDTLLSMTPIALDANGDIINGIGNLSGQEVLNSPFAWV